MEARGQLNGITVFSTLANIADPNNIEANPFERSEFLFDESPHLAAILFDLPARRTRNA
jgi:hypothetical protein